MCEATEWRILGLENAIWDDGEWVSWDEIDRQIRCQEWRAKFPKADLSLAQTFESLLSLAESHYVQTGRHLQVYGEIGELFAGLTLNRLHAQGSDGRLGNDLVEVKTISPAKATRSVRVRIDRNCSKLFVVRINPDFEIAGRLVDRSALPKPRGKWIDVGWDALPEPERVAALPRLTADGPDQPGPVLTAPAPHARLRTSARRRARPCRARAAPPRRRRRAGPAPAPRT